MTPRHLVYAPLLLPTLRPAEALTLLEAQRYDASYQTYQEDDQRMRIESYYVKGVLDINADTAFRFQYLHDAISGSSPTGAFPSEANYLAEMHDVRTGILGAMSRQFGDHRVEFEASRSDESDYISKGFALSDVWALNQKNTTLSLGANYLADKVAVRGIQPQDKTQVDFFTGFSQILDKNSVVSANLTLGYASGYLNDPYKIIDRNEVLTLSDGAGGSFDLPLVTPYAENRPDHRWREVLQVEGTHFFETPDAALDAVYRLSNDTFGVLSQSIQVEWRQAIGGKFQVTPYFRYYHQSAADFFMNSLDGVFPLSYSPPDYPNGAGPNYSADYRLSALDAASIGLRMTCQLTANVSASVSYERYEMSGRGHNPAPAASYPSADIWSFCASAKF